jgi:hypothetical protein
MQLCRPSACEASAAQQRSKKKSKEGDKTKKQAEGVANNAKNASRRRKGAWFVFATQNKIYIYPPDSLGLALALSPCLHACMLACLHACMLAYLVFRRSLNTK